MSGEVAVLGARADRAAQLLAERGADVLVVSELVNVRYLTGFSGSNGAALVGADGLRRFYTDFRYLSQSQEEVAPDFDRTIAPGDLIEALVAELPSGGGRLGFDDAHVAVKQYERLRELLTDNWTLVPSGGLVEELRAIKDAGEIARIRAAAVLVDGIYAWLLEQGLVGRSEREVALALEHEMRLRGASGPSFPSIVASGEHSALPHAQPRDVAIPPDTLVTVDIGAQLDGYCSDCTRTFATGELADEAKEVYELVLEAQEAALAALTPGLGARAADGVARTVIEAAGHGEHFGHGLGHGVGLEIHEAPRLARSAPDEPLRAGNVVTVEPGVYLPGRFGVRIEDLVVVGEQGAERLSLFGKELIVAG